MSHGIDRPDPVGFDEEEKNDDEPLYKY